VFKCAWPYNQILTSKSSFDYDTSSSEHKGKHFGTQEKLWRLRRWYEESSTKSQSFDQKMHQGLKTLMRTSFDGIILWRKQVLNDTSAV